MIECWNSSGRLKKCLKPILSNFSFANPLFRTKEDKNFSILARTYYEAIAFGVGKNIVCLSFANNFFFFEESHIGIITIFKFQLQKYFVEIHQTIVHVFFINNQ